MQKQNFIYHKTPIIYAELLIFFHTFLLTLEILPDKSASSKYSLNLKGGTS